MEPAMTFEPGTYFVGDLGFVLPNDDLRELFIDLRGERLTSGFKQITSSSKEEFYGLPKFYWSVAMPYQQGTLYDQNGNGFGFDWGCFGVLPWEWVDGKSSYHSNKIEFVEPFECSFAEDSITIGHLHFTFNPQ
jgi:hypothetical protein